jgi:formylglycine-generating enzyme required for sulfatase activity
MKRVVPIALAAIVLLLGVTLLWLDAGRPSMRVLRQYGLSYGPKPTGRTLTVEGVEFVEIGPGCFRMGSDQGATGGDLPGRLCARLGLPWGNQPKPSNEMPVHWEEFSQGFWIARTEVTHEQHGAFHRWRRRSRYSLEDRDPVLDISWKEAKEYCAWASEQSGLVIRLPSEAEWECACRGGSTAQFGLDDDDDGLARYAWYRANAENRAHEVGTLQANRWGLHDLHGNAFEWCEDVYTESYENAAGDGSARTWRGIKEYPRPLRVLRGGAFVSTSRGCRAAIRGKWRDGAAGTGFGFRPALSPSED